VHLGVLCYHSGVCAGIVCHINGRVVKSITCADVQFTEDCRDFILQHGTYPSAVVSDLAGYWRAFQQGESKCLHYVFAIKSSYIGKNG